MALEEVDRAVPGQFRRMPIVDRRPLLVGERVVRVVAEDLELLPRGLQAGLEGVDRRRLDEVVATGEVALQRHLEIVRAGRRRPAAVRKTSPQP